MTGRRPMTAATRSISHRSPGINQLVVHAQERIHSGLVAYDALEKLHADRANGDARTSIAADAHDLGYALPL
jgi:cytochrome d ubiquinol oxidase subunit I